MTYNFCRAFVFAVLAVVSFAEPSAASTLPLAFADVHASNGVTDNHSSGQPPQIADTQNLSGPFVGRSTAAAGFTGVSATAFGFAIGLATETYFFRVDGPQSGVLVPLSLTNTMSAIVNSGDCSEAGCQYGSASASISYDKKLVAQRSNTPDQSIDFLPSLSVMPGDEHEVDLFAEALTIDTVENQGTFAQANSSLTVQIDPIWLLSNPGYSLEFSDGINNEPLVTPLPPALPMFSAALLALGAFGWWRRRQEIT